MSFDFEKTATITITKITKPSMQFKNVAIAVRNIELAEVDLHMRGPGDLMGTQQSGMLNLKIADLSKDAQLVVLARNEARRILELDPTLSRPVHQRYRLILSQVLKSKPNWGKIA